MTTQIATGVPQDTIIGPLLFTLYFNYSLNICNNFKIVIYTEWYNSANIEETMKETTFCVINIFWNTGQTIY